MRLLGWRVSQPSISIRAALAMTHFVTVDYKMCPVCPVPCCNFVLYHYCYVVVVFSDLALQSPRYLVFFLFFDNAAVSAHPLLTLGAGPLGLSRVKVRFIYYTDYSYAQRCMWLVVK